MEYKIIKQMLQARGCKIKKEEDNIYHVISKLGRSYHSYFFKT